MLDFGAVPAAVTASPALPDYQPSDLVDIGSGSTGGMTLQNTNIDPVAGLEVLKLQRLQTASSLPFLRSQNMDRSQNWDHGVWYEETNSKKSGQRLVFNQTTEDQSRNWDRSGGP